MNKIVASPEQAVADIPDGATVAIAGFGVAHRFATALICALRDQKTKDLTLVCNSLGDAGADVLEAVGESGRVGQVDLVDGPCRLDEVDVRIAERREGDLVRRERESSRGRARKRLDVAS